LAQVAGKGNNMVQVDVFWAYGLGASLAVASGRQLARQPRPLE
jgi:hypothetical protein